MAKPHGSVRIGPISLFALIIILCLSVLSVLSFSTAASELRTAERQAQTTTETYQLETVGQAFLAQVDAALREAKPGDDDPLAEVLAAYGVAPAVTGAADGGEVIGDDGSVVIPGEAIAEETIAEDGSGSSVIACPAEGAAGAVQSSGTFDGEVLSVTFSLESGRQLACALRVNDNQTYTLQSWKVTTQWTDDGTGETLWLG